MLEALENQSFKDFEVVIVVDGSTDGTIELKNHKWNLKIKWLEQKNSGRAAVRNKGAIIASGKVLLFLDDDTIPEYDVVWSHLKHHHNKDSVLVGNHPVIALPNDHEFQKFRQFLTQKWISELPDSIDTPMSRERPFLTSAHFSIKKKLFKELGGFDYTLNDGEDLEFAIRLIKRNIPIYFDKNLLAFHDDYLNIRDYISRLREYKKAKEILLAKGYTYSLIINSFNSYENLSSIKKWVYRLFCRNSVLSIIEKNPMWIKLIPARLRFKCYNLLVTGFSSYFTKVKI